MRDIVERLKQVADLKVGDSLPAELFIHDGTWAWGMSLMLYDAIREIETLREYRQRIEKAIK